MTPSGHPAHKPPARRRSRRPQPTSSSTEAYMSTDLSHLSLIELLDDLAEGECRFDPELHTGPDAFTIEPPAERMAREDAAREVCETCPVWDSCLEYAL